MWGLGKLVKFVRGLSDHRKARLPEELPRLVSLINDNKIYKNILFLCVLEPALFYIIVSTGFARRCSTNTVINNRPGVAGAVLQTPSLLIH